MLLSGAAGTESFAGMRAAAPGMSPTTRSLVFVLAFAGFGSKAGLVPLHVWLPRAHPEAPSYVSALMSAAMVNLGLYGVLRVGFDLLGGGPRWWWLLVLVVGALSALYGVLQAMAATDSQEAAGLLDHREPGADLHRRRRRRSVCRQPVTRRWPAC